MHQEIAAGQADKADAAGVVVRGENVATLISGPSS
uniref:Uncharacterized protein n=1 Tax=Glossina morsitans morsitans TaxID=37546 RepID=A0A1B0G007_GLOMM